MISRAPGVQRLRYIAVLFVVCSLLEVFSAAAQQPSAGASQARITRAIDESKLVRLDGNVNPLTHTAVDRGAAADAQLLHRMLLLLSRSSEQESALRNLLDEQQTQGSASYHKWLTPAQFGKEFGPAQEDVQTVTSWLTSQGFEVTRTANSKTVIEFNGTAGQVRHAFHTQIHQYEVNGKDYWANAGDPQIPAALASVVKGFASLNNFPRSYYSRQAGNFRRDVKTGEITPDLDTSNGYYGLAPGDFATIYNSLPLLGAGNDGSGQTIALVGETDIHLSDITNFRSVFGLGTGNTQVILDGPDPGITSIDEETESDLDVEWSSAVAPGATVDLVESASTEVTQGIDLSALYIVENNLAGVMSESYGNCEANLGTGNLFYSYLWEQASAQGITVIVSSGDSAAAGCDSDTEEEAFNGLAVNGIASTPFNVAAGGTDYNDGGSLATYWSSTNGSVTAGSYTLPYVSALSYIPEMTWNYSCADTAQPGSLTVCADTSAGVYGGLLVVGAGGGRSSCASASCTGYPKPSWQIGVSPNDGVRDLPDISYFASAGSSPSKSFYVICQTDALAPGETACVPNQGSIDFSGVGGTSAAAPTFAGTVALAMQKAGSRLGNINYLLYPVAQNTPSSFHDVTVGNISAPCAPGFPNCSSSSGAVGVLVDTSSNPAYPASTGYDLATGLGTPNITNLVNALASAANEQSATTTALSLNGGTSTITAAHSAPITVAITVANASGTGTGPAGDVAVMSSSGIAIDGTSSTNPLTPGNGGQSSASWSSTLFPGGNYNAYANYSGDGANAASKSGNISVKVTPESSEVFAIIEECSGNSITAILIGSASVTYGGCYFMRYDVADSAAVFLGDMSPVVSSKCSNGTASCATGSLTVTENGAPLDGGSFMLNPHSTAEDRAVQLTGGSHTIIATYPGDPSYNASSSGITVQVSPVNSAISQPTSTPSTPAVNQSVQLVANVSTSSDGAPPSGTVTFYDNGTAMTGTLTMTGKTARGSLGASTLAVLTTSFTTVGPQTVTAQYNGDANYNASPLSGALTVTVSAGTQLASTVTVPAASANPALAGSAVTLTTTVSPASGSGGAVAPTGTVSFLDGSTVLSGTVNYANSGTTLTATLSYTLTSAGSHSITAQYSGDSNYKAATSAALSLTINQPYTLSLNQNAITQTGGGSGTVTLTLAPASGFSGQVDVSCSSSSSQATCTPTASAPNGVTVSAGTNATAPVNYTVPALTGAVEHAAPWNPLGGVVMAGFFLLAVPGMRRRGRGIISLLMLACAFFLMSCGGGSGGGGSTSVTYAFTVKAVLHSNSSVNSTTQFTVTVP
ncbi:MAG: Ig-like domain repeat protein [Terriglobales bacterium]